jgi:hypothetical protein
MIDGREDAHVKTIRRIQPFDEPQTGRAIYAQGEEVERNMHEAIKRHIDGMKTDGIAVPKPQSIAEYVLV